MEGYHRFFIVGLLVIGLVGAHTENHEDHSAQKSKESLLTIENAEARLAAEDTPRILQKRSNPNQYEGMPMDRYDFTMNKPLGMFARESIVQAAPNINDFRPLDLSMGNPASRQAAEVERMRQNAQRSRDARRQRQERERLQRMQEARRIQQEQRDDLIRRQLAQAAARLDALNQIYQQRQQQRQQQQPRPNPRGGPPRPSGSRRPGFHRL